MLRVFSQICKFLEKQWWCWTLEFMSSLASLCELRLKTPPASPVPRRVLPSLCRPGAPLLGGEPGSPPAPGAPAACLVLLLVLFQLFTGGLIGLKMSKFFFFPGYFQQVIIFWSSSPRSHPRAAASLREVAECQTEPGRSMESPLPEAAQAWIRLT